MDVFKLTKLIRTTTLKCFLMPKYSINAVRQESSKTEDKDMFISDIPNPYEPKKRVCIACKYKLPFDYKNVKLLSQFMSSYTGFVYEKHITGLCAAQQKRLVDAVRYSRKLGYMPYHLKPKEYLRDPKLFDPFSPTRPNPH